MNRSQLETALRAVGQVLKEPELVLVGSQSVHAYTDDPPAEVLISEECGVWAKGRAEKLESLAAVLGKNSPFHVANGFYVDLVEPEIVLLPAGWENRLTPMRLDTVTAWCLEMNDLVVSKLNAGRLKAYEFIHAMLRLKLAQFDEVVRRIQTFSDPHEQAMLLARLRISSETMP